MTNLQMGAVLQHLRRLAAGKHEEELPDGQLLDRFARLREESAFAALVRRHGPMVLGVCRGILRHSHDIEDAFQATFLILAQKAASIRQRESVGGWLYEVAYHVAVKARTNAVRRQRYEKRMTYMVEADPLGDMTVRELRLALHEELRQLPEKYRTPLVLCYLEGKTHEEAARQLGWPRRRVKDRLQRGREQLRGRLSQRGLAPMAALSAALFGADGVSMALPPTLAGATIRSVLNPAPVAPAVAALVEGGLSMVSVSKAKVATMVLLAASLLGGAGLWTCLGVANPNVAPAQSPIPKTNDKPVTAPPKPETAKRVEIHGRVLDPDGKPKAGAKLLLLGKDDIADLGASATDGRFTVSVPKLGYLVARSTDAGMAFLGLLSLPSEQPITLRLVKDHRIRGRIVNTEGKPVAGVRVGIRGVIDNTDNTLENYLTGRKQGRSRGRFFGLRSLWDAPAALCTATTDTEGRFAIHGLGADRLVYLRLSGAGMAEEELWIVNREGFDPKPYNQEQVNSNAPRRIDPDHRQRGTFYGPDVSFVAEAEKPIRGVVKDADTGKGRPNVVVYLSSPRNAPIAVPPQATTDAQGRYELHGSRKVKSYTLELVGDTEAGYMPVQVRVADTAGYQPLRADIRVKKGVIVTGKVIDRATGKSVPGFAQAGILSDNPFAKEYPKFDSSELGRGNRVQTAAEDTFRIVITPGPVLLMGGFDSRAVKFIEYLKYSGPTANAQYPQYFHKSPPNWLEYHPFRGGRSPVQGNFCKVLDIKPGAAIVHQDIVLERASALEVKIQDGDGRPVAGVWATDIASHTYIGPLWVDDASCSVYSLEERKPRMLVFYEPKKKLVGSRLLTGEEKPPVLVKLGSTTAIKGRLLDADDQPLASVVVDVTYRNGEAQKIQQTMHATKQVITNAAGAFALDVLIPDLKFELSFRRGKQRFERATKPAEGAIQLKPGECRDLGAIKVKPVPERTGD